MNEVIDLQQYQTITEYLRDEKISKESQQGKQKKKFLAMSRYFWWEEGCLYQKMKGCRVKVLQQYQVIPSLYTIHEEFIIGHKSVKKMF